MRKKLSEDEKLVRINKRVIGSEHQRVVDFIELLNYRNKIVKEVNKLSVNKKVAEYIYKSIEIRRLDEEIFVKQTYKKNE